MSRRNDWLSSIIVRIESRRRGHNAASAYGSCIDPEQDEAKESSLLYLTTPATRASSPKFGIDSCADDGMTGEKGREDDPAKNPNLPT